MTVFDFCRASIASRRLTSSLCVLATATGIAMLCLFSLLSASVASGFSGNARGIDVVVGAKGSALQTVLSSVYHLDVPTGNIDMADFEKIKKNPQVKNAIPLALGDNYRGWRIVGSTQDYLSLYGAQFKEGVSFSKPFEAVAGAGTGLSVGHEFAGAHGFSANSDDIHDFHLYKVTGVLKPTGTVLDRLIVTSYQSVQELHAPHEGTAHAHDHEHDHGHHGHDDEEEESPAEIAAEEAVAHQVTAVLLQVRGPLATINLPRTINRTMDVQAAVPSYEIARLAGNLGLGRDLLLSAGAMFVVLSALMLLSSLAGSLSLRRYDLALMRVMGASPWTLGRVVLTEAMILSLGGTVFGILVGHAGAYIIAVSVPALQGLVLPSALLVPGLHDLLFLGLGALSGLAAALIPARQAATADISRLLAQGGLS